MEESIIKEVLEAQKKYFDSQRDYEQKAETFLKKFLEEHDGMFDMEENEDKFEEVPYVYYQDDGQATECIIKDIYLKGGNIYVDLLGRFHDGSPFEEPFDDVGWDELFHRGDLDDFIAALTDWQDDEEDDEDDDEEDYDEEEDDDDDEDYDEDDDEDYEDEDDVDESEEQPAVADKNTAQGNTITYEATEKLNTKWIRRNSTSHNFADGKGTISLKNGITEIEERAFENCEGLKSIVLPSTITVIGGEWYGDYNGAGAFQGCSELTSIVIPDSVTEIGKCAFANCNKLASIVIPDSVKIIDRWAFYRCKNLTELTIGKSVMEIGDYAFQYCSRLTTVNYNASNCEFENSRGYCTAFDECKLLSTLNIGEEVTIIPNFAFCDCQGLAAINIPDSVTKIGDRAFIGCWELTSINIPDSVTEIGSSAFEGCRGLVSITIPQSVTSIGSSAFYCCSGLIEINVSEGNKVYDSRSNCNAIIETATNVLIKGCVNTVIPDSITEIGAGAFEDCRGLTELTIPNSVTSINKFAFSRCSGLTAVTIGSGVTSIGRWAFKGCSGLTTINIPDSVTKIDEGAFGGCGGLSSDVVARIWKLNAKAMG